MDWVTARYNCCAYNLLREIESRMKVDIETFKGLSGAFPIEIGADRGSVWAQREGAMHVLNSAYCRIEVRDRKLALTIDGVQKQTKFFTPTVNDEGECRLRLEGDGAMYEPWQISRQALEPIMFP